MRRRTRLLSFSSLLLFLCPAGIRAQDLDFQSDTVPRWTDPVADELRQLPPGIDLERVYWDEPGDDRIWASAATYKASFGAEGFTYVPFLGPRAPKNYPLRFELRAVRVQGRELPWDAAARPVRRGNRIELDRGAVQEVYELRPRSVEQVFLVDGTEPGDVDLELFVETELAEGSVPEGLRFSNELGYVGYGTAHLVRDGEKHEISASVRDKIIRLHVPAELRVAGTVVIDPVISTHSLHGQFDFDLPDVAYDVSYDRYFVIWQVNRSATDVDIYSQMFSSTGAIAPGGQFIENSLDHWSKPKVAMLKGLTRKYLVVAEKYVSTNPSGAQYAIWGRIHDAGPPHSLGAKFQVSGPEAGDKRDPDVAGDPFSSPSLARWMVVYRRGTVGNDFDIHARTVSETGALSATILVSESSLDFDARPRISRCGTGPAPLGSWLVVFERRFTSSDWDIFGAVLGHSGAILARNIRIDSSVLNDRSPYVSSATSRGSYMVCYERQDPPSMMATVLDNSLTQVVPPKNLTEDFGFGSTGCRVDTDGTRFAAVFLDAGNAYAATLRIAGNDLVLDEPPQVIGEGRNFVSSAPEIASRYSGGGPHIDYGIVFRDTNFDPDLMVFNTYRGYAVGGNVIRATGCEGLAMTPLDPPIIGGTIRFRLTNVGTDTPGMFLGRPLPALPLCPGCSLGVTSPLTFFPGLVLLSLALPRDNSLVGVTLSVQGYGTGSGTCLGFLRFSDTVDFTIQ